MIPEPSKQLRKLALAYSARALYIIINPSEFSYLGQQTISYSNNQIYLESWFHSYWSLPLDFTIPVIDFQSSWMSVRSSKKLHQSKSIHTLWKFPKYKDHSILQIIIFNSYFSETKDNGTSTNYKINTNHCQGEKIYQPNISGEVPL